MEELNIVIATVLTVEQMSGDDLLRVSKILTSILAIKKLTLKKNSFYNDEEKEEKVLHSLALLIGDLEIVELERVLQINRLNAIYRLSID